MPREHVISAAASTALQWDKYKSSLVHTGLPCEQACMITVLIELAARETHGTGATEAAFSSSQGACLRTGAFPGTRA